MQYSPRKWWKPQFSMFFLDLPTLHLIIKSLSIHYLYFPQTTLDCKHLVLFLLTTHSSLWQMRLREVFIPGCCPHSRGSQLPSGLFCDAPWALHLTCIWSLGFKAKLLKTLNFSLGSGKWSWVFMNVWAFLCYSNRKWQYPRLCVSVYLLTKLNESLISWLQSGCPRNIL